MTHKNNKKYKRVYKTYEEYASTTFDSHMKLNAERTSIYKKLHDSKSQLANFYKTKWCDNFAVTGKCVHGSACAYAHHVNELRQPICLFWEYKGKCKLGDSCPYLHPPKRILTKSQQGYPTKQTHTPLKVTAAEFVPFSMPPSTPDHSYPLHIGTISPVLLPSSHSSFSEEEEEHEDQEFPSSSPSASSEPIPIPSSGVPQTPFSTPSVGPQATAMSIMKPQSTQASLETCSSCSNIKAFDGRCYCCMYHSLVMPSVTFEDQKKLVNNDQDIYHFMQSMHEHSETNESHASFYADLLRSSSD